LKKKGWKDAAFIIVSCVSEEDLVFVLLPKNPKEKNTIRQRAYFQHHVVSINNESNNNTLPWRIPK
jgi:hypothetical protein